MMANIFRIGRLAATVSVLALLSACAVQPEPFTPEQLSQSAKDDRAEMFKGGEPLNGPLTLSEAVARALKYNLEGRAKMMEEALALNQLDVGRWDLLPKLTANAGYSSRSLPAASLSRNLRTQGTSADADPTYSSDRDTYSADLGLSWNLLDFGLSYFTAKQNADRALIAAERKRKTANNIMQDVRSAFWRAAAYQVLKGDVEQAIVEANAALDRANTIERENLRAPAEVLRYQKSLLETIRGLTGLQQDLSTASIELAALINLPPGSEMVLEVPDTLSVPQWTMASERMEELALSNNSDLREQGYQARIAANDTRKAIAQLFPGITFTAGRNYDHNSFLTYNRWYEAGAKLSWNLMNVLSGPDAIKFSEKAEEVLKYRRLALRMAVLAQVHVAERQFSNAVSQFTQTDRIYAVDKRLFNLATAKSTNSAQGEQEMVSAHTAAIGTQLRRFQTYAQVEQAYARMQASLGNDLLPESVDTHDLPGLTQAVSARMGAWNRGEFEAQAQVQAQAAEPPAENASSMAAAIPSEATASAPLVAEPATPVAQDIPPQAAAPAVAVESVPEPSPSAAIAAQQLQQATLVLPPGYKLLPLLPETAPVRGRKASKPAQ